VVEVRFRGATSRVAVRVVPDGGPEVVLALHTASPPPVGTTGTLSIDRTQVAPLS